MCAFSGEATVDAADLESFMRSARLLEINSLCEPEADYCSNGQPAPIIPRQSVPMIPGQSIPDNPGKQALVKPELLVPVNKGQSTSVNPQQRSSVNPEKPVPSIPVQPANVRQAASLPLCVAPNTANQYNVNLPAEFTIVKEGIPVPPVPPTEISPLELNTPNEQNIKSAVMKVTKTQKNVENKLSLPKNDEEPKIIQTQLKIPIVLPSLRSLQPDIAVTDGNSVQRDNVLQIKVESDFRPKKTNQATNHDCQTENKSSKGNPKNSLRPSTNEKKRPLTECEQDPAVKNKREKSSKLRKLTHLSSTTATMESPVQELLNTCVEQADQQLAQQDHAVQLVNTPELSPH